MQRTLVDQLENQLVVVLVVCHVLVVFVFHATPIACIHCPHHPLVDFVTQRRLWRSRNMGNWTNCIDSNDADLNNDTYLNNDLKYLSSEQCNFCFFSYTLD